MKRISIILSAMFLAVSCSQVEVDTQGGDLPTDQVSVSVYANGSDAADSRMAVDTSSDTWSVSWSEGDGLSAISLSNSAVSGFIMTTYFSKISTFSGFISGNTYRLIHPNGVAAESVVDNQYTLDVSEQTGGVSKLNMISTDILNKSVSSTVTMQHLGAVARIVATMNNAPEGYSLTGVKIKDVPTSIVIDAEKTVDDASFYGEETNGTITLTLSDPIAITSGAAVEVLFNVIPFSVAAGESLDMEFIFRSDAGYTATVTTSATNSTGSAVTFSRATHKDIICSCDLNDRDESDTTTTVAELAQKVIDAGGSSITLNSAGEVCFEAIITSSTLSNNTLSGEIMLQGVDGVAPNNGISLNGCTTSNMKLFLEEAGVTSLDSFGVKVKIILPAASASGVTASISKTSNGNYLLSHIDDDSVNTEYLQFVEVVDLEAIDITNDLANIEDYRGMFVTVPEATCTTSGVWGAENGSTMTLVPMTASSGSSFYVFIKGACSGTYGFMDYYYTAATGSVTGTILVHSKGCGIAPRTNADVEDFMSDGSDIVDSNDLSDTTIGKLISLVNDDDDLSVVINENSEVNFTAVITTSSVGNNVLHQTAMFQGVDADGNIVTDPLNGLAMNNCTNANLITFASSNSGESFGVKVTVTIPSKASSGYEATMSKTSNNFYQIAYSDANADNTQNMTYQGVVDIDPIDVTDKLAELVDYSNMFVTVPSATLTTSGTWGSSSHTFIDMTANGVTDGTTSAFYIYIKNNITYWSSSSYVAGTGSVTGTVTGYAKSGIAPRTLSDVSAFCE